MDDLLEEFIAETRETLELLSEQLLRWEKDPSDLSLVDSVFRFVHTVKGSCGFLDLPRLLKLSHAAEDMLSSAREGRLLPGKALVTAILAVIDRIAELTDALESGKAVFDDDDMLIAAMLSFVPQKVVQDASGVPDSAPAPVAAPAFPPVSEAISGKQEARAANIKPVKKRKKNREDGLPGDMADNAKSRSVRVSLALLDKLMIGVSDMVLARNEVSRQLRKSTTCSDLTHCFAGLSQSVAEMRDTVGLMRMQPIERLFSSLPRLLRDIAQELNKDIDLKIEGGQVEVDREMVEALRDPLLHILRNAADHGIEGPQERVRLGKPAAGLIRIVARQSGNQIMLEIADDGRGIDMEKLEARAIAAKLFTAAQWQKMPEKSRLATIFLPGFSTSETISAISGRGVGMDIVKTNLQTLGGSIDLENAPGSGLKISLRLPLTLSIIAGLSVKCGDQLFGISRSSVVELLSMTNSNVAIKQVGESQIACVRGIKMPYARIEDILGVEYSQAASANNRTLVIIRPAVGAHFALNVAAVVDTEELVVKPGAGLVLATGLYAGVSLPDNGKPMLLLDSSGLAAAIGAMNPSEISRYELASETVAIDEGTATAALLFIDTGGKKAAIRLSVIDRMEELDADRISFSGGKMRAMVDEGFTEIFGLDEVPQSGHIQMLKISDGYENKYLAVSEVLDIFSITGEIAPSAFPDLHEGIVDHAGEATELLNPFHFFESNEADMRMAGKRPLCYIECGDDDIWERKILEPLLTASGYQVSYNSEDKAGADVLLGRDAAAKTDGRMLLLRDSSHPLPGEYGSIYRYDRVGLISAINHRLAGGQ